MLDTCPYCGNDCDPLTVTKIHTDRMFRSSGVHLTPRELATLAALAHRHVPISYDQLINFIYSDDIDGGPLTAYNCMKINIWNCRKKIRAAKIPWRIETLVGHGHILHKET